MPSNFNGSCQIRSDLFLQNIQSIRSWLFGTMTNVSHQNQPPIFLENQSSVQIKFQKQAQKQSCCRALWWFWGRPKQHKTINEGHAFFGLESPLVKVCAAPCKSGQGQKGQIMSFEHIIGPNSCHTTLVLLRLCSGLSTHLCGLLFKCQETFSN